MGNLCCLLASTLPAAASPPPSTASGTTPSYAAGTAGEPGAGHAPARLDIARLIREGGELSLRMRPPETAGPDLAEEEHALDWRSAVRMAVARYPTVTGALDTLAQQRDLVDVARAGYLPRLQAGVTTGGQGEYGDGQVATLGLTQMLYDFGKTRSAVERERAGVRREQAVVLQAVDDVIGQTTQALVEVHRYQSLQRSARDRIEALRGVQAITELRAQAGAAARSDPIQARARVEAAQSHQLEIESQLRQWRSRLRTYLGATAPLVVASPPQEALARAGGALDAFDLRGVPAAMAAEAERAVAEAELENARAQRYPTISLEATANRRMGPAGARYEEIYGRDTYSSTLVSIDSALYQGGAVAARSRAGANALRAAEARLEAARLETLDALRSHGERIDGLLHRIGVLEARLRSITETRELYWDQYLALGTRNVLDLLNAEQEISQAVEDLANARHDLWAAQAAWLVAAGRAREAFGLDSDLVQGVELSP